MRIAMIGPFGLSPKGTMRVRARPLAEELARRGHDVLIVMPPWHTPKQGGRVWQERSVTLRYVPLGSTVRLLSHLSITWHLVCAALKWRPEVIHCFKPKGYAGLAAWLLWHACWLRLVRVRLVVDEDDWEGAGGWNDLEPYPPLWRAIFAWQERWGLCHNDALTVASRTLQGLAWSRGVPPTRVHYLPNGAVAHGQYGGPLCTISGSLSGAQVRHDHNLGEAPVVLLYTRFFEYDVARIVEVWRAIAAQVPEARLLVVGTALFPQDDARFEHLVLEAGLAERVARAGWVAQERLPLYFAAADVALYPLDDTLVNRAKCSVKLIDLLAAGVAVVADAVGQTSEYLVHDETGLLVSPGDPQTMARAAIQLLRDAPLRRRLGCAAAERIATQFSWAALAEDALRAYGVEPGSGPLTCGDTSLIPGPSASSDPAIDSPVA